ncbi:uncharacterized protein TNCV_1134731 [Trichonephila clavipes]|nr:uncharacterized protein TNCV_1134731 [Trichonephila clavipes]
MIKFIDFCEVWFLPESVAGEAAIVGDHRCHTAVDSKRLCKCSWGTEDQAASTRCQSLSASRPRKQFNLVIDEESLDNACHVWSRIILLKYGYGEALKVRKDNWLQHFGDVALAV